MKAFFVSRILAHFRMWAKLALQRHRPVIIGITGSVGKSSVREAVYSILKGHAPVKVIEHGNSEIGIPLGILGLQVNSLGFQTPLQSIIDYVKLLALSPFRINNLKGVKYLVIEMGIDEPDPPKNMEFLLSIVKPDIAVLLNAKPVHTMQFDKTVEPAIRGEKRLEKIVENIANEKAKIITKSGCRTGIYNYDDANLREIIEIFSHSNPKTKIESFGNKETSALSYGKYEISVNGTFYEFYFENKRFAVHIRNYLLPEELREVLAASILVGLETGLSIEQITVTLQNNFSLPPGRSSLFKGIHNSLIIDSSYNASPAAVEAFLDFSYELKKKMKRPLVFVFGDMRELGDESQLEHERIAEKMGAGVDYLYCIGEQTKKFIIDKELKNPTLSNLKDMHWFKNSTELGKYLLNNLPDNSLVLVKGSQNTIFLEEAVKMLLEDKDDASKLCRQEAYWLKKKNG